jgi:L-malate glycosyltransferase
MNVLILLNSLRVSGTEKIMIELEPFFLKARHNVFYFPLITPFDPKFVQSIERQGKKLNILTLWWIQKFDLLIWRINGISVRLFKWSFRDFCIANFLVKKIAEMNIELIISNSYLNDQLSLRLFEKTGTDYIIVDHGSYCGYIAMKEPFSSRALNKAYAIVGVSNWVVRQWDAYLPQYPIQLIHNAFIAPYASADVWFKDQISKTEYFVFCMHGRATPEKGWEIAILAFLQLKEKGYKVKLVILSDGDYIAQLKLKYLFESDLIFGGFVFNLLDVFKYVKVGLVLSKKIESFGLTILDFFGSGIPVVASNLGGIPEVVNYEGVVGGLLVNLDNEMAPLLEDAVAKMEELINNQKLYASLSARAKEIASSYSIEKCASRYLHLVESYEKIS